MRFVFLVKQKRLVTEPADALFLTFHSKRCESKMTACVHLSQSCTQNTRTELADGRIFSDRALCSHVHSESRERKGLSFVRH